MVKKIGSGAWDLGEDKQSGMDYLLVHIPQCTWCAYNSIQMVHIDYQGTEQ